MGGLKKFGAFRELIWENGIGKCKTCTDSCFNLLSKTDSILTEFVRLDSMFAFKGEFLTLLDVRHAPNTLDSSAYGTLPNFKTFSGQMYHNSEHCAGQILRREKRSWSAEFDDSS